MCYFDSFKEIVWFKIREKVTLIDVLNKCSEQDYAGHKVLILSNDVSQMLPFVF